MVIVVGLSPTSCTEEAVEKYADVGVIIDGGVPALALLATGIGALVVVVGGIDKRREPPLAGDAPDPPGLGLREREVKLPIGLAKPLVGLLRLPPAAAAPKVVTYGAGVSTATNSAASA